MYINEDFLKASFTSEKDDDLNFIKVDASLNLYETEDDSSSPAGFARLYIFNEYMADSWDDLLYAADSISGDVLEVIEILNMAKDNEGIYGLIAVLDHIEVLKEHRGKGFGDGFMDEIEEYLEFFGFNYMGLIPARIYDDKTIPNEAKAIDYYISRGFKPLAGRVGDKFVAMGKSLF